MDRWSPSRRARDPPAPGRRLATRNEVFVAFDHTLRGTGLGRLSVNHAALRRAASVVLRAVRTDRLERRVLNHYPRRELPVKLHSTACTWSQLWAFRRLYAQTRQEQPGWLLGD